MQVALELQGELRLALLYNGYDGGQSRENGSKRDDVDGAEKSQHGKY